jgi:hypothetical protein
MSPREQIIDALKIMSTVFVLTALLFGIGAWAIAAGTGDSTKDVLLSVGSLVASSAYMLAR